jgi:hypothetical protein
MIVLYQVVMAVLAVSLLLGALLGAGRLAWCTLQALRVARFGIAAVAIAGIAGLLAVLAFVGIVWFAYAIGHGQKTLAMDLGITLATALPLGAACYGAWRFARSLQARLKGAAP